MPSTILSCKCVSAFQDRMYGQGKRVHNICKKGTKANDAARCSVCGNVQQLTKAAVEASEGQEKE